MTPIEARYLEISHLTKVFPAPDGRGSTVVVRDFDLVIRKGEFVALIGHSGCGKSTILSIAAGLTPPTVGGVLVDGREVTEPGPDLGVVFQASCLLPWLSALDNVMLGVSQRFPELPHRERRARAESALARVGLAEALHKKPAALSAGMRQRVGIARAFAIEPKVLLLDEPFGALDSLTRYELQDVLLATWRQSRKTAFMVTHDVDEAALLSDRIVMMTNGPAATIGQVLEVDLSRPRKRLEMVSDPEYLKARAAVLEFLYARRAPSLNAA